MSPLHTPQNDLIFLLNPAVTMQIQQILILQLPRMKLKWHQLFARGMTLRQKQTLMCTALCSGNHLIAILVSFKSCSDEVQ